MTRGQKTGVAIALAAAAGSLAAAGLSRAGRTISFERKVVLIFGGSRGLGLVIARELAAEGAHLVLSARDEEELERARAEIAEHSHVVVVPCDIRDRQQVESAVAKTVERFGGIDVLINDAGVMKVGPFEHMTLDDFEEAMATHFWGPLFAMYAALPQLRRSETRRVINISSIGGQIPVPHLLPYVASKFALVGLSEGLHAELAREGIVVTTVIPGLMRTGSTYNSWFKGRHEREFAWFHLSAAIPALSIDARRAARQIIEACRRGEAHLVITPQARAAMLLHALMPETFVWTMNVANRLLPSPTGQEGQTPRQGWDSTSRLAPSAITTLADRATAANNEARH
jgi:NAD(P)-dependent dehydrogenase (short-subunit alcohol dehydrogenase family)